MIKFKKYLARIADYIDMEHGGIEEGYLTDDEKHTIKNIVQFHYANNDSVNNTANTIANYIKENRSWMKQNIK